MPLSDDLLNSEVTGFFFVLFLLSVESKPGKLYDVCPREDDNENCEFRIMDMSQGTNSQKSSFPSRCKKTVFSLF